MKPSRRRPQITHIVVAALVMLFTTGIRSTQAAVPPLMNYQGHLSDSNGPLDGTFPMDFALFAAPTGGSPLWTESYPSITVTAGVFTVLLGEATPLPFGSILSGETLWIETVVNGNILLPRRPIVSVAYAGRAAIADSAIAAPTQVPGGAVVYTRWGRTSCPAGATLVYSGLAGGSNYSLTGGGANVLCMTNAPTWDSFSDASNGGALVYGVEYETSGSGLLPLSPLQDRNVPCTVCLREQAQVSLLIPGTQTCPAGWNVEYAGYLMSTHYTQNRGEFVCVDRQAEGVGSPANGNGHLFYPTEFQCPDGNCFPYIVNRELTCVVCTRP